MKIPSELLYSKEHEWAKIEGDIATIGITDFAQGSLGDITFVELPKVGAKVEQFANVGVIESVKTVSDLYTPLGGEIVEVNTAIDADPAALNSDPYGAGWLIKMKLADPGQTKDLLDAAAYTGIAHD
ncbi:MAG: glycine cleavage system protein GcvH [Candidatus Eremiobacteraeota bacterium]|nr:glycine cleavage system protein GcvH [Candidatus Eremiobacteraeota bacterium]NNM92875.1 glycine cleavage system protein GcvH [Candidatus Eremiobacteraeota bacterium]